MVPLKVLSLHFNQFKVWTLTGPLQHSLFFFGLSEGYAGLGSLTCCMTQFQDLATGQMILHLAAEYLGIKNTWFIVVRSVPTVPNEPQNHHPQPLLDSWYDVLGQFAVFGFHQMWCLAIWLIIITVVSLAQETLFHSSCGFFTCNFANISLAALFFFREKAFHLSLSHTLFSYTCSGTFFNLLTHTKMFQTSMLLRLLHLTHFGSNIYFNAVIFSQMWTERFHKMF